MKSTTYNPTVQAVFVKGVKHCPFCGMDTAISREISFGVRFISCKSCHARGPAADSEEMARQLWEERAME